MRLTFVLLAAGIALATSMMAVMANASANSTKHATGRAKIEHVARGSTSTRKSDRQKCLDKLLPQDGVDCLKKLKAK